MKTDCFSRWEREAVASSAAGMTIPAFLSPILKWSEVNWSRSVVSDSLWPHRLQPARLLCPWDFPGSSAGVDCHFLLQGIFPTRGSNPGLPHCRQTLYLLSHQGSPFPNSSHKKRGFFLMGSSASACMHAYVHVNMCILFTCEWIHVCMCARRQQYVYMLVYMCVGVSLHLWVHLCRVYLWIF